MTRDHYDAAETAAIAHEVMKADAETRGDRFPSWKKDPLGETLPAIEAIPKDKVSLMATLIFSATWSMATRRISAPRWDRSTCCGIISPSSRNNPHA
jgi:hypothetical protein